MGIYYSAKIMVGLPRGDIENQDLLDNDELDVCPPFFDGDGEDHAIAGFQFFASDDYSPSEFAWDQVGIDKLKADFKELTGQEAKVWISPCGW